MGNEMLKIYHCQNCGKEIGNLACYKSSKILRERLPKGDTKIFDVWFVDYCEDCAKTIPLDSIGKKE